MIKIDDRAKELLSKYIGPDGKLMIDESLPDDIKESFQYFNDNDVKILEFGQDELDLERPLEEIEEDDEVVTEAETAISLDNVSVEEPGVSEPAPVAAPQMTEEKIAEVNQNLSDLNNMF